jgi:hypothetical protein
MAAATHNAQIELALADLRSQLKPNYLTTSKKHGLSETTLRRRFKGQQLSYDAAKAMVHQRLTIAQEETLIGYINDLTNRGMPPTPQMIRNFAQDIIGGPVGKNWTGDFTRRHGNRIKSVYIRNIDNERVKAEYEPSFKYFLIL